METILVIALSLFIFTVVGCLISLRRHNARWRKQQLANYERKRMIQREILRTEGQIQWQ